MSEYLDEKILKEKRKIQQEQAQLLESEGKESASEKEESIFEGEITIEGQGVRFERVEIPELQISIMLPDTFFSLSEEVKQYIYPAGNRPSHVYGGENIYYQVSLSKTSHQVPDEGMVKFLPMAKKLMEVMGPKTKVLAADVVKHPVEDSCYHVGILEFISQAVDMSIYNVMFYISINQQLLMGNITFPYKKRNDYVKIAKETIDSIIVLQGGED